MNPYYAVADLASARRNTLLAEAQSSRLARLARQARSDRQRSGATAHRRSPLRRVRVSLPEAYR